MVDRTGRTTGLAERALLVLLTLPIAGFSLFVGYNKALAPLDVLAAHSAWTIHLPVLVGRAIGWLELAAAVTLILSLVTPRLARPGLYAAAWIGLNHCVAAGVHVRAKEWHTLPQSTVVIPLCLVLVWLCRRRAQGAADDGSHYLVG